LLRVRIPASQPHKITFVFNNFHYRVILALERVYHFAGC
jgi:hypothetical protein